MATQDQRIAPPGGDFRISNGPIAPLVDHDQLERGLDVVELPRVSGPPILFAIARDPRTIFTYWYIDWPSVFQKTAPADQQVHLRVYRNDGSEETSAAAEPMASQHYLTVSQPRGAYNVEIGYYAPERVWNSVATSDEVIMPPDSVADNVDVDLATIPLHLSFQRLIDLFRASSRDALAEIISRLQNRAATEDERDLLSAEEWEILRAMDLSLDDLKSDRAAFATRVTAAALRRRAEILLGFGATSPLRAFSESSWR
ncbi:MAG: hypothetical protein DME34_02690 [Verrucomicrobia bacterium]|nr:MAG: hypothetical protein DME34_02690 [Verrucomicrobiota bacterium]